MLLSDLESRGIVSIFVAISCAFFALAFSHMQKQVVLYMYMAQPIDVKACFSQMHLFFPLNEMKT